MVRERAYDDESRLIHQPSGSTIHRARPRGGRIAHLRDSCAKRDTCTQPEYSESNPGHYGISGRRRLSDRDVRAGRKHQRSKDAWRRERTLHAGTPGKLTR